jgi:hypothetical protein
MTSLASRNTDSSDPTDLWFFAIGPPGIAQRLSSTNAGGNRRQNMTALRHWTMI